MLCRKITKWVLSHGAEGIPAHWRAHTEQCVECRRLIAQVAALDGALAVDDVPDPGVAYWEGLAPSVARRIEAVRDRRAARSLSPRWSWVGRWAPAIGVAALAILIARELSVPPTVSVPMDTDPTVTARVPTPETIDGDAGQILTDEAGIPDASRVSPDLVREPDRPAIRASSEPAPAARQESAPPASTAGRDRVPGTQSTAPSSVSDTRPGGSVAGLPDPQEVRSSAAPAVSDTPVWPDRRVTIMGEIDSSRLRGTSEDTRLAEQGAEAVSEKIAGYTSSSAETVGALPPPNRIESPQAFRAAGPLDTPNVAETMRRLDELQDLRRQVGIIQAIAPQDRTPEQNEKLCAMWYRVGMIAPQTALVDSAIVQLGQCLQVLDARERGTWEDRSSQLRNRRATLLP